MMHRIVGLTATVLLRAFSGIVGNYCQTGGQEEGSLSFAVTLMGTPPSRIGASYHAKAF
jgi:hypothetical protein